MATLRAKFRAAQWLSNAGTAVAVVLAAGVLAIFLYLIIDAAATVNSPPRLADPAPTAAPTPGTNGALPAQFRGSYDPTSRDIEILAIVTPLLTTIVGFYFGARAGAAPAEAQAERTKTATTQLVRDAVAANTPAAQLQTSLKQQNLIHG